VYKYERRLQVLPSTTQHTYFAKEYSTFRTSHGFTVHVYVLLY